MFSQQEYNLKVIRKKKLKKQLDLFKVICKRWKSEIRRLGL